MENFCVESQSEEIQMWDQNHIKLILDLDKTLEFFVHD